MRVLGEALLRVRTSRLKVPRGLFIASAICASVTMLAVGVSATPAKTRLASIASRDAGSGSCPRGTKPAIVAGSFKCLRAGQRCKARYQAAYKKYGFVCVAGYLHKRASATPTPPPAPEPPPAPAPAPVAVDGHFKGVTSQNETFEFDIFNGGVAFRGLKTGQVNEGCTPLAHISGNYFDWPNYIVPVTLTGDFTIDTDITGSIGGSPSTGHLTIHGHMNGQAGSGSLELKDAFTINGVSYTCGSGLQTWTVTKVG